MSHSQPSCNFNVLALDAFHGGSHRQFLDAVVESSRHRWTVLAGKPTHWKWRMRSAPLDLAQRSRDVLAKEGYPDLLFCTDMLDLPRFRGLLRDPHLLITPTVIYFHENQWTYPVSPFAKWDSHYGYTNLLSTLAADEIWFNSQYHRQDFISASRDFLNGMPDTCQTHEIEKLEQKSRVVYPGFSAPRTVPRSDVKESPATMMDASRCRPKRLTLGWVARWEHDKCPDQFASLLDRLGEIEMDFELILLGSRPHDNVKALKQIRDAHPSRIVHDGFAEDRDHYWRLLANMDLVISTAAHEFFGIAICEAIWAGAVPIVPDGLSYRELVPEACRYDSLSDAARLIEYFSDDALRSAQSVQCRNQIEPLQSCSLIKQMDALVEGLIVAGTRPA